MTFREYLNEKKKISIQKAYNELLKQGYKLGPGIYDHKTHQTSYEVTKDGKTEIMTADQIKQKIF